MEYETSTYKTRLSIVKFHILFCEVPWLYDWDAQDIVAVMVTAEVSPGTKIKRLKGEGHSKKRIFLSSPIKGLY